MGSSSWLPEFPTEVCGGLAKSLFTVNSKNNDKLPHLIGSACLDCGDTDVPRHNLSEAILSPSSPSTNSSTCHSVCPLHRNYLQHHNTLGGRGRFPKPSTMLTPLPNSTLRDVRIPLFRHHLHSMRVRDAMKQIRHGSDTICHRLRFPALRSEGPCGASPLRPAFLTGTIYWFRPSMGSSRNGSIPD
ncbi:hypothetical protein HAX54_029031 [Datura stramonium]|uniref:Uncharacterized protein n=1 Tax=Datura stramonium TaxID=4076 RepID=A0ABS8V582_DATST|nr:hypothetical protein [Datura stramonium]